MSLESLFQHIIFSEHQAEESRRLIREGRCSRLVLGPVSWGGGGRVVLLGGVGWGLEPKAARKVRSEP